MPTVKISASPQPDQEKIRKIIANIYDIQADFGRMQALLTASSDERPTLFDALRKNYPIRREFHQATMAISKDGNQLREMLKGLGFQKMREEI
jgi:hypothetical protein